MKIDKVGDLSLLTDGVDLKFGADSEITLTHVADTGLTIKNTNTADNSTVVLTLQIPVKQISKQMI